MSRKLSDRKNRRDPFYRKAKKQGFRARAVFKLEEIDSRTGLLSPGCSVLDLGCAPGSWLQYCLDRVGPTGHVVGVDRTEIPSIPGARIITADIHELDVQDLLGPLPHFDVALSDMAPNTTGIRHVDQTRSELLFERALDIAESCLGPGGHFVGKLFQGPEFHKLLTRCRQRFERVKVIKPKGTRARSIEQYVVALGLGNT